MNRDNPVNRWLLTAPAVIMLMVLIADWVFHPDSGAVKWLAETSNYARVVLVGCLVGYVFALFLAFGRGRLFAAVSLVIGCIFVQTTFGRPNYNYDLSSSNAQVSLNFDQTNHQHGIDVVCNDVHLGTTPFKISEEQFRTSVKPALQPPSQSRVEGVSDDEGPERYDYWSQSASDAFQELREQNGSSWFHVDEGQEFFDRLSQEKYWWRFEQNGCIGVRQHGSISNGGGGGMNGRFLYGTSLSSIRFPSAKLHLDRILEAARAADYQPDEDWLNHFSRYQNQLEEPLLEKAKQQPELDQLADYIAASQYDLPKQMSRQVAASRFEMLLEEVGSKKEFRHPSICSRAVLQIARRFPNLVAEHFAIETETFEPGARMSRQGGYNSATVWSGSAKYVRRHLLLTAIQEVAPPTAFDYLAWEFSSSVDSWHFSDESLLRAIGAYETDEAERIFRVWIRKTLGNSTERFGWADHNVTNAIRILADVRHPNLQSLILQRVQSQFPAENHSSIHEVKQFFERKLKDGDNLVALAETIANCTGLKPRDKIQLLWQIPTENAGYYLSRLSRDARVLDISSWLNSAVANQKPNPFSGGFLIRTASRMRKEYPNHYDRLDELILQIDSEEAAQYITEVLQNAPRNRIDQMLNRNRSNRMEHRLPHLNKLIPVIRDFESLERREQCCRLLWLIGTDYAINLLKDWKDNQPRSLARAATRYLEKPLPSTSSDAEDESAKDPIDEDLVKDANALIAGTMKPDDLLPPAKEFVWTGTSYVLANGPAPKQENKNEDSSESPEETASSKDETQQATKPVAPTEVEAEKRPTFEETIAVLRAEGETATADSLERGKKAADGFQQKFGWSYVFGKVVVKGEDSPRHCQSHVNIQKSGWFLRDVGKSREAGFNMFGYRPVTVKHRGPEATFYNVGEIVMEPFRFEELGTVKAKLLFEGPIDPKDVSVRIKLIPPKSRSASGGSGGTVSWPEKENALPESDFQVQKTGLSPMPHRLYVKAPKHQPFQRDFTVEPGGTTDVGLLRIPASPEFRIKYAASETLDFSDAKVHETSEIVGGRFKTNPASDHYRASGGVMVRERDGNFLLWSGVHGCVQIDLGEKPFEDCLQPERPDVENIRDADANLIDGHSYLLYHHTKEWKHWTLLHVEMSSPFGESAEQENQ